MVRETALAAQEPIAIIGLSLRLPGAETVEEFWSGIEQGRHAIETLAREELEAAGVRAELLDHPDYVPAVSTIPAIDRFAASFFRISRGEAELIDPQQRIFLETAWHALEDAGYAAGAGGQPIGVYAACGQSRYAQHLSRILPEEDDLLMFQAMIGTDKDFVASRVAYHLNLTGPAVGVQTACSSSLVAVHLACQAILSGDCDVALAGGVSLTTLARVGYLHHPGMVFAPDGRCRPFDQSAGGTLPASGAAVVVLKPLSAAMEDGDHIRAVILGSAINNDGSSKIGFSAPGAEGQARAIADALVVSDVHPETIGYVEAHGTGTPLGDPVEISALTQAYRSTDRRGSVAIGSLKANLGHLDVTSGVAGLIKTALMLEKGKIPPQIHFDAPNPQIDFSATPFYVNTEGGEWPNDDGPRRAGVSSFGIGGTNAHVILEEPPARETAVASGAPSVLVWSAKTPSALTRATTGLIEHLRTSSAGPLEDLAHTFQVGRRAHKYRRALVADDAADALRALLDRETQRAHSGIADAQPGPIVFMFSGHGGERPGMAAGLYAHEPVFRRHVDECATVLEPLLGADIRDVLYGAGDEESRRALYARNLFTQGVLFTIEYALARLWMSWGVRPDFVIGHSSGEYAAACISGVMELRDALTLAVAKGRGVEEHARGAMLVAAIPEHEAAGHLSEGIVIAAANSPLSTVFSGSAGNIEGLQQRLAAAGVEHRLLETPYAGHSPLMDPVAASVVREAGSLRLHASSFPYVSGVTGEWITPAEITDPVYWGRQTRATVRFARGIETLAAAGARTFLEIGPGRALTSFVQECTRRSREYNAISSLPRSKGDDDSVRTVREAVARLWTSGVSIDWERVAGPSRRKRVPAPVYPFDRDRYWIDRDRGESQPIQREAPDRWLHEVVWQEFPVEPRSSDPGAAWLIVGGSDGRSDSLVAELRAAGVTRIQVAPQREEDYEELFRQLGETHGGVPSRIVHTGPDPGIWDLISLARAIGAVGVPHDISLYVLTRDIWSVTGTERIVPRNAAILGPCRVIPHEYENIRIVAIDDSGDNGATVAALLLGEDAETEIAVRDGRAYVPRFQQLAADPAPRPGFRMGGVYLITGGLGGVGVAIADHLTRTYGAKVALAGRGRLPDRQDWDDWQNVFGPIDPVSGKLQRLEKLLRRGAEVEIIRADIGELSGVREAISRTKQRFGQIDGVIHAAGIVSGGVIQSRTLSAIENVLGPKVRGTELLLQELAGDPLDFVLLCSSITGLAGDAGQVDHAAASAFLDALAWSRRGDAARVISVDWDTWSDTGGAARAAIVHDTATLQRTVSSRPVASGWFDFCRESGGELELITDLERRDVVLIDILNAALAEAGLDVRVDANELALARPVAAGAGYLRCAVVTEGGARCTISSRSKAIGAPWEEHFRAVISDGRVAFEEPAPPRAARIAARKDAGGVTAERLALGLTSEEASTVLEHALAAGRPQVIVSTIDLSTRLGRRHDGSGGQQVTHAAAPPPRRAASGDALLDRVLEVFAAALGLHDAQPHDHFFELGGSSLIAIRLTNRLGRELGTGLSADTLLKAPTPFKLAELLRARGVHPVADSPRMTFGEPVITLRPGNDAVEPLFLIHPAGGTVMCYQPLVSALGEGRPVYGIQSPAFVHGLSFLRADLVGLASQYLELIRSVYPEGTFHCAGASFGGAAALEIARQAAAQGCAPGTVFMLDTPSPAQPRSTRSDIEVFAYLLGFAGDFGMASEELQQLTEKEKLRRLRSLRGADAALAALTDDQLHLIWQLCRLHAEALYGYQPHAYAGSVVYLSARERNDYTPREPERAWQQVKELKLTVEQVAGDHLTMLEPRHVGEVAAVIAAHLSVPSANTVV